MLHTLLHARIEDFISGGGGGGGGGGGARPNSQKRVWTFFYCFFSPQLILQFTEGSLRFYNRENYTFEGFRGGPIFSKGGPTFSIGDQVLISIETHITCDFPGGVKTPYPPSGSALASLSLRHVACT